EILVIALFTILYLHVDGDWQVSQYKEDMIDIDMQEAHPKEIPTKESLAKIDAYKREIKRQFTIQATWILVLAFGISAFILRHKKED
ncbi:MAG TPA: hypothetical protein VE439_11195, partial [Anaerolineae bacterium]|nr:hypothetical protein [Anaerolineae bacterium]